MRNSRWRGETAENCGTQGERGGWLRWSRVWAVPVAVVLTLGWFQVDCESPECRREGLHDDLVVSAHALLEEHVRCGGALTDSLPIPPSSPPILPSLSPSLSP